jgi:Na+/H+ antiporter NhaC
MRWHADRFALAPLPSRGRRRLAWGAVALIGLVAVVLLETASGQETSTAETVAKQPTTSTRPVAAPAPRPPEDEYGAWVLVPPIATIILAIALRQVIPALSIGVLIAAFMLVPCLSPSDAYGGGAIGGLRLAVETYLVNALGDTNHIKIIVFTFSIGGMVGIIAANGGTGAVVNAVARWASNRRRGQITTWLVGLIVFFDDYANAMIVGPSMRPICDRLRISRAKLAYIVDSTAAPVSSIALIGTWVGAEIGYIKDGLKQITDRPAFLSGVTEYGAFLSSIPYRFYVILALVMVFLIGLLGRDFGAMRKAERAVPPTLPGDSAGSGPRAEARGRVWYALVPILVLVFGTLALLVVTGWPAAGLNSIETPPGRIRWVGVAQQILEECDPYNSILYGALAAIAVALAISLGTRALRLGKCVDSATESMARMFPTMVVLVLAWTLSATMEDLRLGQVAQGLLQAARFDPTWLPLLIFVSACVVSFATGTSWGTMGILCPATVTIAAGLLADMPPGQALPLFYASVGAVLSGAVFGDHCSPISDTTVLSSLASECSLEAHVWTQIPYALTVAVVSTLSGEVLCRQLDQPAWVGLLLGVAALVLIVLLVGRKPTHADEPAPEPTT